MLIFSAVAIYLTSLWNKGFIIESDWLIYLKASLVIAAVYYLVVPVSKLVLLPLNIITLGLVSVAFYCLVLFFLLNRFALIEITGWDFPGFSFGGIIVIPVAFNQWSNVFVSALSLSAIINLSEKIV